MALQAVSASASCENLPSVSMMGSCGLLAEMRPSASGTARRITGSP